jgi:hypothetical protein
MKRITIEVVQAAYSRMGYQPIKEDWYSEGEPRKEGEAVYFACPQTTILELAGLISHDEEGPNIESAADDEWGSAYANGFRDGWDGLSPRAVPTGTFPCPADWSNYELGHADGCAAAGEFFKQASEP